MKNKIIRPLLFVTVCCFHISLFAQNVGVNTTVPVGKLHVKGSDNTTQLIIEADTIQTNTNPLIKLRTSSGLDLLWMHSDDSTNTFLGLKAGRVNVIGPSQGMNNTFIGSRAGYSNTNGRDNTVLGNNALFSNTKGGRNVAIGTNALFSMSFTPVGTIFQCNNVAVGYEALYSNQPTNTENGGNNTAVGNSALRANTIGTNNTGIGNRALFSNISGSNNIGLGAFCLTYNTIGNNNIAVGLRAMDLNAAGNENIAIGSFALFQQSYNPGNFWDSRNVAIGSNALRENNPVSISTGIENTAIGVYAMNNNTSGYSNTGIGSFADVVTGDLYNATAVGANAKVAMSNALVLGGTGVHAVNVGIGTQSPQAMLDVNGDVRFGSADLILSNGVTPAMDVNTNKFTYYRLSGPSDTFEIAGISAGINGRFITLLNASGFPMQLNNTDDAAVPADQMITGINSNLTLGSLGMVTLTYDGPTQKWIVNNANKRIAESVWDTTGVNIFFNHYVGLGTETPTARLSIETGLNEAGISHKYNGGSTTITSTITDVGASIGTSSDDIFSLAAGGDAKVHVWPNGNVVIGDDADPLNFAGNNPSRLTTPHEAKLTIETPINSSGWIHIGGADSIIVSEGVGGVSAALGTLSNHAFRLNTNGQGRMTLLSDGNIVVGTNSQGPFGKFTVHTPDNSDGIVHVSDGGIILKTIVGGISAGIGTFSNDMMRIFSNSVSVINIDPAGNIGIGISNPLPGYKMAVNGNIKAKELVIETDSWPDYVFGENYQPMSLNDLKQFIAQHHHLPNIPSAGELETDGVAVGEMQKKMMEKIEELTLYLIQQQNEIEELKATLASLKK